MKSIIWNYPQQGLTREQAEQKIYSLGFRDAEKGFEMVFGDTRIHIIPSGDYMTMHRDNKHHTVMGGTKTRKLLKSVLADLENNSVKILSIKLEQYTKKFLQRLGKKLIKMSEV